MYSYLYTNYSYYLSVHHIITSCCLWQRSNTTATLEYVTTQSYIFFCLDKLYWKSTICYHLDNKYKRYHWKWHYFEELFLESGRNADIWVRRDEHIKPVHFGHIQKGKITWKDITGTCLPQPNMRSKYIGELNLSVMVRCIYINITWGSGRGQFLLSVDHFITKWRVSQSPVYSIRPHLFRIICIDDVPGNMIYPI